MHVFLSFREALVFPGKSNFSVQSYTRDIEIFSKVISLQPEPLDPQHKEIPLFTSAF